MWSTMSLPERREAVEKMARTMTAGQIARRLGTSRSAIAGFASRVGVRIQGGALGRRRVDRSPPPAAETGPEVARAARLTDLPDRLTGEGCCRWPVGDGFCGGYVHTAPYCERHRERMYYRREDER